MFGKTHRWACSPGPERFSAFKHGSLCPYMIVVISESLPLMVSLIRPQIYRNPLVSSGSPKVLVNHWSQLTLMSCLSVVLPWCLLSFMALPESSFLLFLKQLKFILSYLSFQETTAWCHFSCLLSYTFCFLCSNCDCFCYLVLDCLFLVP